MKLEDGKGKGFIAGVTSANKLQTEATQISAVHVNSVVDGQVFLFSTEGFVSITSVDTETGVLYLKNTSNTKNLIINSIRTCGNQIQKVIMYKDPTGGTLISAASLGSSTNINLTSGNESDAVVYKGVNGSTVSGGVHMAQHINNIGHSTVHTENAMILGKDNSVAITFEVAIAGDVCVSIEGYFQ